MPIYEYECKKCAFRFELKRRFSEDGGSICCPRCKGQSRRILSPSAIVFKGSGFYVTDSRSSQKHPSEEGKANKADKANKAETGKKSESNGGKGGDQIKKVGHEDTC